MDKFKFDKNTNDLFRAFLSLENIKEAEKFFRDLCTVEEIRAMSERWQIVRLLEQGLPYRTIAEKTGASTTTVGRVATWLNNGEGGYRLALTKSASHHNTSKAIGKC
jgi:TrpR-related protein YerC/YecD